MIDFEFAKENYYREWDSKTQLDSRLNIYVVILSILGSALFYLIQVTWPASSWWAQAGALFWIGAIIFYFLGLRSVLRAVLGFDYKRIPLMTTLEKFHDDLETYYHTDEEVQGTAEQDFRSYLARQFTIAASENAANNIQRAERFYAASRFLVIAVLAALATALVLGVNEVISYLSTGGGA